MKIYPRTFRQRRYISTVQIARIPRAWARYARTKGKRRRGEEGTGWGGIETGNAVTRAALWCRMFTLWPRHDCDSVGLYRRARDVINEVPPLVCGDPNPHAPHYSTPNLTPSCPSCLLLLHHITRKRLQSLDRATPRGQPVSCYKRSVPHTSDTVFYLQYITVFFRPSVYTQVRVKSAERDLHAQLLLQS